MSRSYSLWEVRLRDKENLGVPEGTDKKLFTGNEVLRLRVIKFMVAKNRLVDGCNYAGEGKAAVMTADLVDMSAPEPENPEKPVPFQDHACICPVCSTYLSPENPEDDVDYAYVKSHGYCSLCANHLGTCRVTGCASCENITAAFYEFIEARKEDPNYLPNAQILDAGM